MAMAPRTDPLLRYHQEQDDTFYVLEGLLTVQAGEEIVDLAPGDFLSIPPRMAHTFDNLHNGDELVRTINVMTPGGLFPAIEDMARVPEGAEHLDGLKVAQTAWHRHCRSAAACHARTRMKSAGCPR